MHLKVIACEIAAREIWHCAARSVNTFDITLYTQGLHDNSGECREELQKQILGVPTDKFDGLLLGYGLCNNSIVGLRAGGLKMILPRAHDCITFFMGGKERYAEEFSAHPGTYYYTSGWLECPERRSPESKKEGSTFNQGSSMARASKLHELIEKYGEENGRFLFDTMTQWEAHYDHGTLIRFPFDQQLGLVRKVREICQTRGWMYGELAGDLQLLQDWMDGKWDEERFLIVPPGAEIRARYDERIVEAVS